MKLSSTPRITDKGWNWLYTSRSLQVTFKEISVGASMATCPRACHRGAVKFFSLAAGTGFRVPSGHSRGTWRSPGHEAICYTSSKLRPRKIVFIRTGKETKGKRNGFRIFHGPDERRCFGKFEAADLSIACKRFLAWKHLHRGFWRLYFVLLPALLWLVVIRKTKSVFLVAKFCYIVVV